MTIGTKHLVYLIQENVYVLYIFVFLSSLATRVFWLKAMSVRHFGLILNLNNCGGEDVRSSVTPLAL